MIVGWETKAGETKYTTPGKNDFARNPVFRINKIERRIKMATQINQIDLSDFNSTIQRIVENSHIYSSERDICRDFWDRMHVKFESFPKELRKAIYRQAIKFHHERRYSSY